MVKAMQGASRPEPPSEVHSVDAETGPLVEAGALGGRLRLRQPRIGYRAGMDAALLAAAVDLRPGERAIEAGCGVGAALLQVALREPAAVLLGLDRSADAVTLASANIALNDVAERVEARLGSVAQSFVELGLASFDAAFANPPFFDDPSALRAPHPARRASYLADDGLAAWIRFLLSAVRDGGRLTLIHRADRLADILEHLRPGGGSIRIRPVQPYADQPAKRVLVRAVKGGRAPLALLAPLVLHDRSGAKHTPLADAILRGQSALDWA